MAVKSASGVDGSVTLPTGKVIKCDNWSLVVSQAQVPTTGFGDTFVTRVGGLKDGAISFGGTFKYDATTTSPGLTAMTSAPESFVFQVATACTYTFTATINSAGASSDVAGAARASYSGFTSGSIVEAWDETA
jgi:hypothetical protein